MIEVEIKLRISDREQVLAQLLELGFQRQSELVEVDRYFDNEEGRIRSSDQALRIREVTDLQSGERTALVTFKGQRMDDATMTRPEYETKVSQADQLEQMLNALGYFAVRPYVEKKRLELVKDKMHACLDQVTDLGDFLELEIVVSEDTQRKKALSEIEIILHTLGYQISDTTTISYLTQLQRMI